jgi:SAM-dependent methyltransferase/uncharacterized protein YbaR (Trm112 family)
VRPGHFDALTPFCPVCRPPDGPGAPLRTAHVVKEENGHIVEGVLHCTNQSCLREFPILDGIPILVTNIRQYLADNILTVYGRRDLSPFAESILGDCCGPGSIYEQTRQQLSSYSWDHYGDLDPAEGEEEPHPGSMLRNLDAAGSLIQAPDLDGQIAPQTSVIDAGCSVGRSSFALAEKGAGLVLGVDLNFAMLRLASEVLRHGRVRYSRRRLGLVYEQREFPARFENMERVDFWACDAAALPLPPGKFSLAVSLNVLDCVYAPRELLVSLARVLQERGKVVLACPYDWSAAATPLEAWLGGHSQRSPTAGSSEAVLRSLLTPGAHPSSLGTLKLMAEREGLPWHVRLHDRSTMTYRLHMVAAEKV